MERDICLRWMMMINNKRWGTFLLGDEKIFTLHSTLNGIDKNKLTFDDEKIFPYVTRSKNNNGLDMFVSRQSFAINKGNVISIGLDTQTVFYQETDFYTGQNVQILYNEYLNKNVAMFLIPIIKKQLEVLNWGGNGATLGRLKKKRVSLPITDSGNPDWKFMEEYIRIKTNQIKDTYQFPKLHEITDNRELNEVKWKAFTLDSITVINSGRDWEVYNRTSGSAPFIGASSINNGITDFVNVVGRERYTASGVIGINRNGSVGYAFYHPYKAYFSGDTRFLEVIGYKNNRYVNQFIQTTIMKQKEKYAYGYKMGTERIKRQVVMLPQKDDKPDYNFMEQYMKRMENRVIQKVEQ